jgi:copper oxidase (laccase) domain-containing protein
MGLEFGTRPEDVTAASVAIGRCCYEVGPEVARVFVNPFARPRIFDGPFEQLALGEEPNPLLG